MSSEFITDDSSYLNVHFLFKVSILGKFLVSNMGNRDLDRRYIYLY